METLFKIADPVLNSLSNCELKKCMPVEQKTSDRPLFTHLEAFLRTLVGIAPWIELGDDGSDEGKLREKYAALARKALDAATDPMSPDYLNFSDGFQTIVDSAFLAHAILRAPTALCEKLEGRVKENLITCLKKTGVGKKPSFNNWLLFSGIIEAALYRLGEDWDHMRVDYCLKQMEKWYCGDGFYCDGPEFHMDFYNSFVIHPMLLDILRNAGDFYEEWANMKEKALKRAKRHSIFLERIISPEGAVLD